MKKSNVLRLAASAALLLMPVAASAGEYGNRCTMGLAMGKDVDTDCKISQEIDGKTYCFGNEEAKTMFMKDAKGNLEKAAAYEASKAKK